MANVKKLARKLPVSGSKQNVQSILPKRGLKDHDEEADPNSEVFAELTAFSLEARKSLVTAMG
jgi:hypothetical protein